MKLIELRNKYLKFFKENGHAVIPGAPLVPDNDPTVLFTTAGMHPLVPFLSGEKHPSGKRLTDFQKCLRTDDIDEVGDSCHLTFFEMLGNWSLGDYGREEAILLSFNFLTKELKIDKSKLSVTCFEGDENCPKDNLSASVWEDLGIDKKNIYFFGKKENWWGPAGESGPCGPDTEMFIDTGKEKCSENCSPACSCGKYIEIWNDVFMEYNKKEDGSFEKLEKPNVDTGLGLERMAFILQGVENVFETEIFKGVLSYIKKNSVNPTDESLRVISDHLRASIMLIIDKVVPSNLGQGYILRRLIRRGIRHMRKIEFNLDNISLLIEQIILANVELYPEMEKNKDLVLSEILQEKEKFEQTLINGEKEFVKITSKLREHGINKINGKTLFRLYDTFGFPPEVTKELAKEINFEVDMDKFDELYIAHQEVSRKGSESKFKGGLADSKEETVAYHTATHLIHQALKNILGDYVEQRGANITAERIRFDFVQPVKVERDILDKVEEMVNNIIEQKIPVVCEELNKEQAIASGAHGIFNDKYGDRVKVYTIGNFSKEICGGPHVTNTGDLHKIKIIKEESVSSGVRRIKAVFVKE